MAAVAETRGVAPMATSVDRIREIFADGSTARVQEFLQKKRIIKELFSSVTVTDGECEFGASSKPARVVSLTVSDWRQKINVLRAFVSGIGLIKNRGIYPDIPDGDALEKQVEKIIRTNSKKAQQLERAAYHNHKVVVYVAKDLSNIKVREGDGVAADLAYRVGRWARVAVPIMVFGVASRGLSGPQLTKIVAATILAIFITDGGGSSGGSAMSTMGFVKFLNEPLTADVVVTSETETQCLEWPPTSPPIQLGNQEIIGPVFGDIFALKVVTYGLLGGPGFDQEQLDCEFNYLDMRGLRKAAAALRTAFETDAMDGRVHYTAALKKIFENLLDRLPPELKAKERLYRKVWELEGNQQTDPEWGKKHLLDDIDRLYQAVGWLAHALHLRLIFESMRGLCDAKDEIWREHGQSFQDPQFRRENGPRRQMLEALENVQGYLPEFATRFLERFRELTNSADSEEAKECLPRKAYKSQLEQVMREAISGLVGEFNAHCGCNLQREIWEIAKKPDHPNFGEEQLLNSHYLFRALDKALGN